VIVFSFILRSRKTTSGPVVTSKKSSFEISESIFRRIDLRLRVKKNIIDLSNKEVRLMDLTSLRFHAMNDNIS